MPSDIKVSVDDFLESCSYDDIQDVIEYLRNEGHIKDPRPKSTYGGVSERAYEDSLNALHGNWNMLSSEEEQSILSIARRFLH